MELTHGSLFSGIGGFDLGFERAGFKSLWQVEIDDYATRVLEKHFPDAKRFRDIKTVGRHNLVRPTVITGGFPCQDISIAGKGAGITGERSGLWSEYRRVVSELRPQFVVVENVSALLFRGLGRVLGDLSEIGYDAEWEVLSAADFGARHFRPRTFLVAYPQCDDAKRKANTRKSSIFNQSRDGVEEKRTATMANSQNGRLSVGQSTQQLQHLPECGSLPFRGYCSIWHEDPSEISPTQPELGRLAYGIPDRVHRLKCLGNAVVPQIAEEIAWMIRRVMEEQP